LQATKLLEFSLSNKQIPGVFWTKSEPILKKILTLISDCRPAGDNPAQRFRTASAEFIPHPCGCGASAEQNRKIF
jgi:hypothetical protein